MRTTDPDLAFSIPQGWNPIEIAVFRAQAEAFASQFTDPGVKNAMKWQLDMVDAGQLRAVARGTSGPTCASSVLGLWVRPVAGSFDDAVNAWLASIPTRQGTYVIESRDRLTLRAGPSVRIATMISLPEGIPSRTLQFLVSVPGQRLAVLAATAPVADADFPALIDAVAASLTLG